MLGFSYPNMVLRKAPSLVRFTSSNSLQNKLELNNSDNWRHSRDWSGFRAKIGKSWLQRVFSEQNSGNLG
jgi:hypothetical protein